MTVLTVVTYEIISYLFINTPHINHGVLFTFNTQVFNRCVNGNASAATSSLSQVITTGCRSSMHYAEGIKECYEWRSEHSASVTETNSPANGVHDVEQLVCSGTASCTSRWETQFGRRYYSNQWNYDIIQKRVLWKNDAMRVIVSRQWIEENNVIKITMREIEENNVTVKSMIIRVVILSRLSTPTNINAMIWLIDWLFGV